MQIYYLGHSSFKIVNASGEVLVTDPYPPEIGITMPKVSASAVTMSHDHYDHCYVRGVGGNPAVIDVAGSHIAGGYKIEGINSFHDNSGGQKRGKNIIFKIMSDGLTLCHLGDLGQNFSQSLADEIGQVDVLFIPVGGNYTIDGQEAAKYISAIAPKIAVPMHYLVDNLNINIEGPQKFFKALPADAGIVNKDVLQITSLQEERTQVVVLRRI